MTTCHIKKHKGFFLDIIVQNVLYTSLKHTIDNEIFLKPKTCIVQKSKVEITNFLSHFFN
jgi:hypothetical protein